MGAWSRYISEAETNYPHNKQLREERVSFSLQVQAKTRGSHMEGGGESLKQLVRSQIPSRAERNGCIHAHLLSCACLGFSIFRQLRTPCLGNGASHCELGLLISIALIEIIPQTCPRATLMSWLNELSQVIHGCVTSKASITLGHFPQSGSQHGYCCCCLLILLFPILLLPPLPLH